MSNTAPSRADPVVVFPLGRWCPPQETSQPHPPPKNSVRYLKVLTQWHLVMHHTYWSTLFEVMSWCLFSTRPLFNTFRPRQNGRHFPDDIFICIFLTENVIILIEISLKFVPKGSINNIPTLFQIMAWRQQGDKPLSEPMMIDAYMRHSASMS